MTEVDATDAWATRRDRRQQMMATACATVPGFEKVPDGFASADRNPRRGASLGASVAGAGVAGRRASRTPSRKGPTRWISTTREERTSSSISMAGDEKAWMDRAGKGWTPTARRQTPYQAPRRSGPRKVRTCCGRPVHPATHEAHGAIRHGELHANGQAAGLPLPSASARVCAQAACPLLKRLRRSGGAASRGMWVAESGRELKPALLQQSPSALPALAVLRHPG